MKSFIMNLQQQFLVSHTISVNVQKTDDGLLVDKKELDLSSSVEKSLRLALKKSGIKLSSKPECLIFTTEVSVQVVLLMPKDSQKSILGGKEKSEIRAIQETIEKNTEEAIKVIEYTNEIVEKGGEVHYDICSADGSSSVGDKVKWNGDSTVYLPEHLFAYVESLHETMSRPEVMDNGGALQVGSNILQVPKATKIEVTKKVDEEKSEMFSGLITSVNQCEKNFKIQSSAGKFVGEYSSDETRDILLQHQINYDRVEIEGNQVIEVGFEEVKTNRFYFLKINSVTASNQASVL